ncbi:MAG: hypothetical protein IPO66_20070 [Rhodanobacteraceae bacterium]|nr:hypothetical protein [Rhodanobacteraceae bacterium]
MPGLASLIKLGKFAVNKTMRPLEAAVEKTVKAYIEGNLATPFAAANSRSTTISTKRESPAWATPCGARLAPGECRNSCAYSTAPTSMTWSPSASTSGGTFARHRISKAIYTDLVQAFFDRYGDSKISVLAADFGITESMVADELVHALGHGVDKALASGYLEQRIRAHLRPSMVRPRRAGLLTSWRPRNSRPAGKDNPQPATQARRAGRSTATAKAPATSQAAGAGRHCKRRIDHR